MHVHGRWAVRSIISSLSSSSFRDVVARGRSRRRMPLTADLLNTANPHIKQVRMHVHDRDELFYALCTHSRAHVIGQEIIRIIAQYLQDEG